MVIAAPASFSPGREHLSDGVGAFALCQEFAGELGLVVGTQLAGSTGTVVAAQVHLSSFRTFLARKQLALCVLGCIGERCTRSVLEQAVFVAILVTAGIGQGGGILN